MKKRAELLRHALLLLEYQQRIRLWLKHRFLYVEDIFVDKEFRKKGIGAELYKYVRKLAQERKCQRNRIDGLGIQSRCDSVL